MVTSANSAGEDGSIPREYLVGVELCIEYLESIEYPENKPTLATMKTFKSASHDPVLWKSFLKHDEIDRKLRTLKYAGVDDESLKKLEEEMKAEARKRCRSRDPKMMDLFEDQHIDNYLREDFNENVCAVRSRNPPRLIIADSLTRQVDSVTIAKVVIGRDGEASLRQVVGETLLDCIFENIEKIRDPLLQQTRWKLSIARAEGKAIPPSISEPLAFDRLCDYLVEHNLLRKHGLPGKEIVSALLVAYEDYQLVAYRTEIQPEGFFLIDDKLVASKVDVRGDITREEAAAAIQTLEEMQARFYPRLEEQQRLAHLLKFAVQSPFDFAKRQMKRGVDNFIPRIDIAGRPNTGKTYGYGRLALSIHDKPLTEPYFVAAGSAETAPRFINKTSKTTFPIIIDEADGLVNVGKDDRLNSIMSVLKNQATMTHPRDTLTKESEENSKPSFSPVILTHNSDAISEEGTRKRFTPFIMTERDIKTQEQQAAFEQFFGDHKSSLKTIGDFAVAYIMEHLDILRKQWTETGSEIMRALYSLAGSEYPAWLDFTVPNESITDVEQDRREQIRSILLEEINQVWARNRSALIHKVTYNESTRTGSFPDTDLKDRVTVLLQHHLLSTMRVHKVGDICMLSSTLDLLMRRMDRINMQQLADLTGFVLKPVFLGGKTTKAVVTDIKSLTEFLQ